MFAHRPRSRSGKARQAPHLAALLSDLIDTLLAGEPLRLHTQEPERPQGAPKMAPAMLRRIEASLAYAEALEDGAGAWWQSAEVRRRVQARMLAYPRGGEAYAVLAYHAQGRLDWDAAIRYYGGNEAGLLRMYANLHNAVRKAKDPKGRRR